LLKIGQTDHGAGVAAVALGATVIEKHFTLSRADGGVTAPTASRTPCSRTSSNNSAPAAASQPTAPPPRATPCSTTPASSPACYPTSATPPRPSKASTCPAATSRFVRPKCFPMSRRTRC
jgi:hypothetical protein